MLVWQQGVSAYVEHAQTGHSDCESTGDMLFLRKHNFIIQKRETGQCQETLDIYDIKYSSIITLQAVPYYNVKCDPKIKIF